MSDRDQPSKSSEEAVQRNAGDDNRYMDVELVEKRHKEDPKMSEGREAEVKKRKASDGKHGYVIS